MSATPRHAKRSLLARFAALFRYDPARPPKPVIYVGMPGFEIPAYLIRDADGRAQWERVTPVHMCPDSAGIQPCCGLHETEVPATDRVTTNRALVTCNAISEEEEAA